MENKYYCPFCGFGLKEDTDEVTLYYCEVHQMYFEEGDVEDQLLPNYNVPVKD